MLKKTIFLTLSLFTFGLSGGIGSVIYGFKQEKEEDIYHDPEIKKLLLEMKFLVNEIKKLDDFLQKTVVEAGGVHEEWIYEDSEEDNLPEILKNIGDEKRKKLEETNRSIFLLEENLLEKGNLLFSKIEKLAEEVKVFLENENLDLKDKIFEDFLSNIIYFEFGENEYWKMTGFKEKKDYFIGHVRIKVFENSKIKKIYEQITEVLKIWASFYEY